MPRSQIAAMLRIAGRPATPGSHRSHTLPSRASAPWVEAFVVQCLRHRAVVISKVPCRNGPPDVVFIYPLSKTSRRVPLSGLSSSGTLVPAPHCWQATQWHPCGLKRRVKRLEIAAMPRIAGGPGGEARMTNPQNPKETQITKPARYTPRPTVRSSNGSSFLLRHSTFLPPVPCPLTPVPRHVAAQTRSLLSHALSRPPRGQGPQKAAFRERRERRLLSPKACFPFFAPKQSKKTRENQRATTPFGLQPLASPVSCRPRRSERPSAERPVR